MACKPKKGESRKDFVSRFMEEMKEEIPDDKDRKEAAGKEYGMEEETFSIDEVEIFEAGKWNGDNYTEKDLDDMVQAFDQTKGALKPYLKLGHSNNQALLQKDGMPSAGWITSIKRNGKKLLAKLENVPEKIYKLIVNKAYGRISSEIFWNLNLDGKKYRRALKAVALLGADTPAVSSLNDFIDLYTENYNAELKCYHILQEDDIMSDEKILELQSQLKELTGKVDDLTKEKESLMSENSELKEHTAKVEREKKEAEVTTYLDQKLNDGLITPAQVDHFTALALGEEVRTYTNGKNQKIEGTPFDLVKNIIESGSQVDFTQDTKNTETDSKVYSKKPGSDSDELDKKIKEYAKEHKVTYAEAFDAISYEEVD